jgi:hypothetical protein
MGGVLIAFRNARWKGSSMPGSSTLSAGVVDSFAGRFMTLIPYAISLLATPPI